MASALIPCALSACAVPTGLRGPARAVGIRLTTVDVASSHACGITPQGDAYCWGEGSSGELGTGSTEYSDRPARVVGGHRFAQVSTSFTRTCAVTVTGEAFCWGSNPTRQVTRSLKALEGTNRSAPVRVAEGLTLARIGVGGQHTCALATDGRAYCWGPGFSETLGGGVERGGVTHEPVSGGYTFAALSVGDDHTCAITAAGDAYCWGRGTDGQLGHGAPASSAVPVRVAGGLTFRSLSAGARHTCGVTTGGEAYCWGWNFDTQLGVPTAERCGGYPCSTTPVRVSDRLRFASVSAGEARTCAIASARGAAGDEVYCWGDARPVPARVAAGDTANYALPRAVLPGHVFTSLSISNAKACGLVPGGETLCWSVRVGLPAPPRPSGPPPRFVLYAIIGAVLGGLIGALTRPWDASSLAGRVAAGAFTGGAAGFLLGAFLGFSRFLADFPW